MNDKTSGGVGGGWEGAVHLRPILRAGVSWGCCPLSADSTSGRGGVVDRVVHVHVGRSDGGLRV